MLASLLATIVLTQQQPLVPAQGGGARDAAASVNQTIAADDETAADAASPWKTRRVLVAIYGVIPRGIKLSYPFLVRHLYTPLREEGLEVTTYVFNLDVGNTTVDGAVLNQSDISIINHQFLEERSQADLDGEIAANLSKATSAGLGEYTGAVLQNALRSLYQERRAGEFVAAHAADFDLAVVVNSDHILLRNISREDIRDAAASSSGPVYVAEFASFNGVPNGFYFGRPERVPLILDRSDVLDRLLEGSVSWPGAGEQNYESMLLAAFQLRKVPVGHSGMLWFKAHADRLMLETDAMICWANNARVAEDNHSGSECIYRATFQPNPRSTCGSRMSPDECRDELLCAWDVVSINSADVPVQTRLAALGRLTEQGEACSCPPEGLCGLGTTPGPDANSGPISRAPRIDFSSEARTRARLRPLRVRETGESVRSRLDERESRRRVGESAAAAVAGL